MPEIKFTYYFIKGNKFMEVNCMKKLSKNKLLWIAFVVITALTVAAMSVYASAATAAPFVYAQTEVSGNNVVVKFNMDGSATVDSLVLSWNEAGVTATKNGGTVSSGDTVTWADATAGVTFSGLSDTAIVPVTVSGISGVEFTSEVYISRQTSFTATAANAETVLENASKIARTSKTDITVTLTANWTWSSNMKIGSGAERPYRTSKAVVVQSDSTIRTINSSGKLAAMFGNYEFKNVNLEGNGSDSLNGFFFVEGCKGTFNNITTDTGKDATKKMNISGGNLEINSGCYAYVCGVVKGVTLEMIDNVTLTGTNIKFTGTGCYNFAGGAWGNTTTIINGKVNVEISGNVWIANRAVVGSYLGGTNAINGGTALVNTSGKVYGQLIASHVGMRNEAAQDEANKFTVTVKKGIIPELLGAGSDSDKDYYVNSEIIIDPANVADVTVTTTYAGLAKYNGDATVGKLHGTNKLTIKNGTFSDAVYGGSNLGSEAKHDAATTVTISGGTFAKTVYSGSNINGGTHTGTTTSVINDGIFNETVYGGSYVKNGSHGGTTSMTIQTAASTSKFAKKVYGGSYLTTGGVDEATSSITVKNGNFSDIIYGGSFVTSGTSEHKGSTNLIVETNGTISVTLYGGSRIYAANAKHSGESTLTLNKGTFKRLVGGSDMTQYAGEHSGKSNVVANNGTFKDHVYGGSDLKKAGAKHTGATSATINAGVFSSNVYGGSAVEKDTTHNGNTTLTTNGGEFNNYVFGGSRVNGGKHTGDSALVINKTGKFTYTISGGSNLYAASTHEGASTLTVNGGASANGDNLVIDCSYLGTFGGSYVRSADSVQTGDCAVYLNNLGGASANGSFVSAVYGGVYGAGVLKGNSRLEITNSAVTTDEAIYAGSGLSAATSLQEGNSTLVIDSSKEIDAAVYGGSLTDKGTHKGSATATINNGTFKKEVFGGAYVGKDLTYSGPTTTTINGGTFASGVYGGSETSGGIHEGTTTFVINGGVFSNNAFGGSQVKGGGTHKGTINLTVNAGTFKGYVYGASYLTTKAVNAATSTLTIKGGNFTGTICGGSFVTEPTSVHSGQVNLIIDTTGEVNATIFGGSRLYKPGSIHTGKVNLTINNGVYSKAIYSGSYCQGSEQKSDVTSVINGGTFKYLEEDTDGDGKKEVTKNAEVYGGSYVITNKGSDNETYKGTHSGNVSLTIKGGTFEAGVYGGAKVSSGNVDGNVTVVINNGTFKNNVYGGVNLKDATYKGTINFTVNGGTYVAGKYVYGASYLYIDSIDESTSTLTIKGGNFQGSICGGSFATHGTSEHKGKVNVVIDTAGSIEAVVYGGSRLYLPESVHSGEVNLTIKKGTLKNLVYGGSYIQGGKHTAKTTTVIEGGTFAERKDNAGKAVTTATVYGGSFVTSKNDVVGTHTGEISLTINNGTFNNSVFGGSNVSGAIHDAKITFVINAGTFNQTVFGGSQVKNGTHKGTANLTIQPKNADTKFVKKVYGGSYLDKEAVDEATSTLTIKNGAFADVIYGGSFATTPTAEHKGDTTLILDSDVEYKTIVYGGSRLYKDGATHSGNATLIVKKGTFPASLYGGSDMSQAAGIHSGSTNVTIEKGTYKSGAYGGSNMSFDGAVHSGKTNMVINAGTFNGYVAGGSKIAGAKTLHSGDSSLTINGGLFVDRKNDKGTVVSNANVYGGSTITKGATHKANSTLTINNGEFTSYVFGGSRVSEGKHIGDSALIINKNGKFTYLNFGGSNLYAGSTHEGASSITINGGKYAKGDRLTIACMNVGGSYIREKDSIQKGNSSVYVNDVDFYFEGGTSSETKTYNCQLTGDIYGGSYGKGTHKGNSLVKFTNSSVAPKTAIYGGSRLDGENALHNGKSSVVVDGSMNTSVKYIRKAIYGGSAMRGKNAKQTGASSVEIIGTYSAKSPKLILDNYVYGSSYITGSASVQQLSNSTVTIKRFVGCTKNGALVGGAHYIQHTGLADLKNPPRTGTPTSKVIIAAGGGFNTGKIVGGFRVQNGDANVARNIYLNSVIVIQGTRASGKNFAGSEGGSKAILVKQVGTAQVDLYYTAKTGVISNEESANLEFKVNGANNKSAALLEGVATFRVVGHLNDSIMSGDYALTTLTGFDIINLVKSTDEVKDFIVNKVEVSGSPAYYYPDGSASAMTGSTITWFAIIAIVAIAATAVIIKKRVRD